MNGGGLVCYVEDLDGPVSCTRHGGWRRDPGGGADATAADGPARRQTFERGWKRSRIQTLLIKNDDKI